uniref:Uncharacterized protein n=1 Tax=Rhodnius prolixus TaxID=13249 RepID=T1HVW4_RHOPR
MFVCRKKWSDEMLLKKFPDFERKLLEKIIVGIEQEMLQFRNFQNVLATLNRELFRKHDVVSKCVKNELVLQFSCKGTVVPPIWQLIEFAENSKSYYAALYFQLEVALCSLKYGDESTVAEVENTILNISKTNNEMKDILAITAFCRE